MDPETASVFSGAIYDSQALLEHNNLRHIPQIHREQSRKQKTLQTFSNRRNLLQGGYLFLSDNAASNSFAKVPTGQDGRDTSIPNTDTLFLTCFSCLH